MALTERRGAEANEKMARRMAEEIWSNGRLDVIDEILADEFVGHTTSIPDEIRGPEGYKEYVSMYRSAFPDLEAEVKDVIATDEWVASRYVARGTHEGALRDIEPTGKSVEISGIVMSRFENGRCVEEWNSPDTLGLMQQLGVVPQ